MVHEKIVERTTGRKPLLELDDPSVFQSPMSIQYPIPSSITTSTYTDPLDSLDRTASLEKIVGLWAGGYGQFRSGIFHPTGFCVMRGKTEIKDAVTGSPNVAATLNANYFCPVCRYIIADALDPLVHPDIDILYDRIYPTF